MVKVSPCRLIVVNCYNNAMSSHPLPQINDEIVERSLGIVKDVFLSYRSLLLERAGNVAHTSKADGSPVTDIDVEIEQAIKTALMTQFPEIPVFGEESGYDSDLPAACWLIDPIDGTKSFIENKPTFTCMAVLIVEGQAVTAVIYNPSTNDMYTAQKGRGSYKNNIALDLRSKSLPKMAWTKGSLVERLDEILEPVGVKCEISPNGAGYGFTQVSEGLVAARFQVHGQGGIHDYAPGGLLIQEAGGVLVPINSDKYTIDLLSFVACHPDLEGVLLSSSHTLASIENNLIS